MVARLFSLPHGVVAVGLLATCAAACGSTDPEENPPTTTSSTTTTATTTTTTTETSPWVWRGLPLGEPPQPLPEEIGLDEPVLGPAMGMQSWPEVAYNGSRYLAVWWDTRPGGNFAALVDKDGTALDPAVIPLPVEGSRNDVASDGQDFLVIGPGERPTPTEPSPGLMAVRVSADGQVLGTSLITPELSQYDVKVASSGAGYVALWVEQGPSISDPRSLHMARIALDGTVLDPGGVVLDDHISNVANVAFDGTSYVVAWNSMSASAGSIATLDADGALLQQTTLPVYPRAMECNGGSCLVLWGDDELRASWMAADGTLADPQGAEIVPYGTSDGRVAVGFDGVNGVVAWSHGTIDCSIDEVRYTRITKQGVVLTPGGTQLQNDAGEPGMGWDGDRAFLVWSDNRQGICDGHATIYGANVPPEGTVLSDGGVVVSRSANGQVDPSLAFDGEDFLITWSDERNFDDMSWWDVYALRANAEGVPLEEMAMLLGSGPRIQTRPRAVFDGTSHVSAWWDCFYPNEQETECTVMGARVDQGGVTPLTFPYQTYSLSLMPPALSSGADGTLVTAFVDSVQLATATVGPTGVPGSPVFAEIDYSTRVASASAGADHLVVWNEAPKNGGALLGARVAQDGTLIDTVGFPIAPVGNEARSFAIAFGGGEYLVAWYDTTTDVSRVLAARVGPDGAVLDSEPLVLAEHPECPPPATIYTEAEVELGASAVAFDGERFAIGWRACGPESRDLFGALVDIDGTLQARFAITADDYPDEAPAMGGTGAGRTLIAYSSFRAEAPLGTWRIYTRRLDGAAVLEEAAAGEP